MIFGAHYSFQKRNENKPEVKRPYKLMSFVIFSIFYELF